ncbi:MAG: trypsin-like peptidase domain-containing protein [Tenericutes bacterium]|nr:trypsin-like peptidase domain-containing protein [Mycoplasmatota bacterium]
MGGNLFKSKIIILKSFKRSVILLSFLFILPLISCSSISSVNTVLTDTSSYSTTTSKEYNAIYDDFKYSIFRLDSKNNDGLTVKQGTGYILKEDGTFITNAHVLEDAWNAEGRFDGFEFGYDVEGICYYNEDIDLAVGKLNIIDDFKPVPVEFSEDYYEDDVIYSIGYPSYATEAKITEGIILSTYYTSDIYDMVYIRTNSLIKHGNSGGILASEDGKVLGITSVSFSDDTFGSIRSVEYSEWQTNEIDNLVSLTKYFHPSEDIYLDKYNIEDYFTINLSFVDIIHYEENCSLLINYMVDIYPDVSLESIGKTSDIFIALEIRVDYHYYYIYYDKSLNYEIVHGYNEVALSFLINGPFLIEHFERSMTIIYENDDVVTISDISYSIVFAEGYIRVYD